MDYVYWILNWAMTIFYWMIEGYKDSFLNTRRWIPRESCSAFSPNKIKDKIIKTLKDNQDNTIKYQNESHTANIMGKKWLRWARWHTMAHACDTSTGKVEVGRSSWQDHLHQHDEGKAPLGLREKLFQKISRQGERRGDEYEL